MAVLLDLGGTVLREESYDLRAGVAALLDHPSFRMTRVDRSAEELVSNLREEIDRVHATNAAEFTLLGWLRGLLPQARSEELQGIESALWGQIAFLKPMPGVVEALTELRRCSIRMAVVSNAVFSGTALRSELERQGLEFFFELVVSSADLGVRKPDPRIFREALFRLGARAADAWFVGDAWREDIVGAAGAGMIPFWMSDSEPPSGQRVFHRRIAGWGDFLRHLGPTRTSGGSPTA